MLPLFLLALVCQIPPPSDKPVEWQRRPKESVKAINLSGVGSGVGDELFILPEDRSFAEVPVALDHATYRVLHQFDLAKDRVGVREMVDRGDAIMVPPLTKIKVIEHWPLFMPTAHPDDIVRNRYCCGRVLSPGPLQDKLIWFDKYCMFKVEFKAPTRPAPAVNPNMHFRPQIRRETELLEIAKEVELANPRAAAKLYKILERDYPKSPEAFDAARRSLAMGEK
jgi:hypothetical protein